MSSKQNITEESNDKDFFAMDEQTTDKFKTGYSQEAVARFKRLNYVTGLNGHYEYASANTLRNSVKAAIDMDGSFDRFKVSPRGSHFATTHYNESTFKTLVSKFFY